MISRPRGESAGKSLMNSPFSVVFLHKPAPADGRPARKDTVAAFLMIHGITLTTLLVFAALLLMKTCR